jgi:O-phosphoseryl-tRNA(Cys) synthetase
MEMHVMMGVDMVEAESSFPEGVKLRTDFRLQLTSHLSSEKKIDSSAEEMRGKFTLPVHQIGDCFRRQDWRSVDQYQM